MKPKKDIKEVCLIANKVTKNNTLYTSKSLKKICPVYDVPITVEFDDGIIIGVADITFEKGKLMCSHNMTDKMFKNLLLALGFNCDGIIIEDEILIPKITSIYGISFVDDHSQKELI